MSRLRDCGQRPEIFNVVEHYGRIKEGNFYKKSSHKRMYYLENIEPHSLEELMEAVVIRK